MIDLDDLLNVIVPSFQLGFCGGGILVLVVSAFTAAIHLFVSLLGRG